jgi:hypothetical protein
MLAELIDKRGGKRTMILGAGATVKVVDLGVLPVVFIGPCVDH